MTVRILTGDCRQVLTTLPDESVHCVVTSPPYFGLRDYGHDGQIGLEETLEAFIAEMVAVFAEVRRVLRADGTLWLNLGDSYASAPGQGTRGGPPSGSSTLEGNGHRGGGPKLATLSRVGRSGNKSNHGADHSGRPSSPGLKPKDLMGVPWRVAFALQADGWWLRQDIIWAKPNPMPESVRDRCTKAHEYLFLLTKSERYFYDSDAISEGVVSTEPAGNGFAGRQGGSDRVGPQSGGAGTAEPWTPRSRKNSFAREGKLSPGEHGQKPHFRAEREVVAYEGRRNKRSVWTVATEAFKEAHFATYPQQLIEPCILAGSPTQCCSACGAPWERQVERHLVRTKRGVRTAIVGGRDHTADRQDQGSNRQKDGHKPGYVRADVTLGFEATCGCAAAPGGGVVLDPFGGSGTTGLVAARLGRDAILIELNPEYAALADRRLRAGLAQVEGTPAAEDPDLPLFAGAA